jgi:hypothetical protein
VGDLGWSYLKENEPGMLETEMPEGVAVILGFAVNG